MHPALSAPPGLALTSPWGFFEILLLVTFAAHLLVVNVALGGVLIALFSPGPGRGAAVDLGKRLPTSVAIGVNLAIPPLLFASVLYGRFLYTAATLSAAIWLPLFLVVMLAYALFYRVQPRLATAAARPALAVAAGLLLAASAILVNVSSLAVRPAVWMAYFDNPGGTILNWRDATFLPRWLHFIAASLVVSGLFLALLNRKAAVAGDAAAQARQRLGLTWFTLALLAQFVLGSWYLFSMPATVTKGFLGGKALDTAVLTLGVLLVVAALVQGRKGAVGGATLCVVATACVMVTLRELARLAYLAPDFSPAALPVAAQTGPFLLFLASGLFVGAAVVWAVAVYRRQAGRA